jgi:hypothetical protein
MFIPGINVVNEGYLEKEDREEGVPEASSGSMFLVFKGRISGYRHDHLGNPTLLKTYDVGKLFGRHSALFYEQPYNKVRKWIKLNVDVESYHDMTEILFVADISGGNLFRSPPTLTEAPRGAH